MVRPFHFRRDSGPGQYGFANEDAMTRAPIANASLGDDLVPPELIAFPGIHRRRACESVIGFLANIPYMHFGLISAVWPGRRWIAGPCFDFCCR